MYLTLLKNKDDYRSNYWLLGMIRNMFYCDRQGIIVIWFDGNFNGINKDLYCAILKRINVHLPNSYFLALSMEGFLVYFSSHVQCVRTHFVDFNFTGDASLMN